MTAQLINPAEVATDFRNEIRQQVASLPVKLNLVGFLSTNNPASKTYADYTKKGCDDVGINFEIRQVDRLQLEHAILEANQDPEIHGIITYYPVFNTDRDHSIKNQVDYRKDIEGLNDFWVLRLFENKRYIDADRTKKAILPCTPLAIIKLIEKTHCYHESPLPLAGKTITIFNRSDVVGRPLASMLANDGAEVFSFDEFGPLLINKQGESETDISRSEALASSDIVITGVPSRTFALVQAVEIKEQATCINFSTFKNFDESILEKASIFIPRVGPMTVTMALRNTLRLYSNYFQEA